MASSSTANDTQKTRIGDDSIEMDTQEPAIAHPDDETASDESDSAAPLSRATTHTEQFDPGILHILLTHLSLLALSRHPSRPVIELNLKTQLLQLDAFLLGYITEDGDATHWVPESETKERQQLYAATCSKLVPRLTALIQKQSKENLADEPKNRVQGNINPEHHALWKLNLAPSAVERFDKWIEQEKQENKTFSPDFDPWLDPVKNGELIGFLNSIVNTQYDFAAWAHTSPIPTFKQLVRPDDVVYERVMTDPSLLRAYYRIQTPSGKVFSQLTTIPEPKFTYTEKQARAMWRDKSRPKYLIPDPADCTIPPKRRGQPWRKRDDNGKVWARGDDRFALKIVFFVFDERTNVCVHHHVIEPETLDKVDINDEAWVLMYRRRITQWRARATGAATMVREPWTVDEKGAVYAWVNAYCRIHGVDALNTRAMEANRHSVLEAVNRVVPGSRSVESVTAWVRNQMVSKPDEPLGRFAAEQKRVADLVAAGRHVPDQERYPDEAIDLTAFGAQSRVAGGSGRVVGKRKRAGEDGHVGHTTAVHPIAFNLHRDSDTAWLAREVGDDGLDEQSAPPHRKRVRFAYSGKGKQRAEAYFEYYSDCEGGANDD